MSFNPHTIIIATGTTVMWVNDDNSNHSLTSKDGWFNSEMMEPQDSFDFEFDKPGTFSYSCKVHPEMEGIVVIQLEAELPQSFSKTPMLTGLIETVVAVAMAQIAKEPQALRLFHKDSRKMMHIILTS
jgi:hypothetical protein